jgi:hypothetical protein
MRLDIRPVVGFGKRLVLSVTFGYAALWAFRLLGNDIIHIPPPQDGHPQTESAAFVSFFGVLTGCIATVIVIFLNREETAGQDNKRIYRIGAIGAWACAFLFSMVACFQFAALSAYETWWGRWTAQYIGPADTKRLAIAARFPQYLYNLNGLECLLGSFLLFYGMALAVGYCTDDRKLHRLLFTMVLGVYAIGNLWVFRNFIESSTDTMLADHAAYCYAAAVFTASLVSIRRSRHVSSLLLGSLAACMLCAFAVGGWYAYSYDLIPRYVAAHLPLWESYTTLAATLFAGLALTLLMFVLWTLLCTGKPIPDERQE